MALNTEPRFAKWLWSSCTRFIEITLQEPTSRSGFRVKTNAFTQNHDPNLDPIFWPWLFLSFFSV